MKENYLKWTASASEDPAVLKALIPAHRNLAELKGLVSSLPNENILLFNLRLQEAKDSSAIENIVTTQDSLYRRHIHPAEQNPADKEVYNYVQALDKGWKKLKAEGGISLSLFLEVQKIIEPRRPGLRKVPGTVLKNTATGKTVYTPPSPEKIPKLMSQLEHFINADSKGEDPLIKTAVIHHWFESVHPFYDGNGRTGRIINILCLSMAKLLDSPVLYLSRYILQNRADYYRLLQEARDNESGGTDWILYMIEAVSSASRKAADFIQDLSRLFKKHKNLIRENHKFYSHDLINNIFSYPYTKAAFLKRDMKISHATAVRYLDKLTASGILNKNRSGRETYYINKKLFELLKRDADS